MALISVIIPVYNCEATVAKAIESAQAQTLQDIEIVVVDDCSTDNSHAIVENFARKDPRIKTIKLPQNGGSSVARNTAIANASAEWLAVLDSDDWYEPQRLEMMFRVAEENSADLVCDNLKIYDHVRGEIVDVTHHGERRKITPISAEMLFRTDHPLRRHAIGYVKPMMRKSFLYKHSIGYDPVHRAGQDFILLAEIVLNGGRSFMMPQAYYVYVHRISPTSRKISPTSRSEAGFVLIVRGCDELMERYGNKMTPATQRALRRRRWIFQNRVMCQKMLLALRQRRFVLAAKILLRQPFILVLIGVTIAKTIYMKLLVAARSLRKSEFSRAAS